jgi:ligand-binding sensor domain-containing protein
MRKFLLILVSCFQITASAQVPFFQQYDLLKKNQVTQINTLFQDRDGFVWVASGKGLFRLDGKSARHYNDSTTTGHITAMANDSLGRLWLGYNNGSIRILSNNTFSDFHPEEGNATMPISAILFDSRGWMWFSTLNDGLYYYKSGRLYRLDEQEGLPDLYVYHISEDANGRIIASTDRGMAFCSVDNGEVAVDVIDSSDGLPDNIVRKTATDNAGGLWVATDEKGIFKYVERTGSFTPLLSKWTHGTVNDFIVTPREMWIATSGSGLVIHSLREKTTQLMSDKVHDGLSSVRSMLLDHEGNIWCGSRKNVLRTPGTSLQFYDVDQKNIQAVTIDLSGNLWYSNTDGLFRLDAGADFRGATPVLTGNAVNKTSVISLYTDHHGFVWAGLYGEGLIRIDPFTRQMKRFNQELRNGNILNITGDDKYIWLATLGGASRITNDGSGSFTVQNFGSHNGLSSDFIYQVFLDSRGRVWFATDGDGVDMFDGKTFCNYTKGLPSTVVYSLAEDGHGKIWANVQGNGVFAFDDRDGFINPLPGEMRHNDIFTLSTDNSGNLVLSHELGIDIIDTKRNRMKFLGDETGLDDRTVNLNATGRDRNGALYLGTTKGIVRFSEGNEFLRTAPLARIGSVKVFDRVSPVGELRELSHDENNITINFIGLWFKNPDDLQFYYKLENYDRDWIMSKNTSVTYSKLPPGNYTFRVKVAEDGNLPLEGETSFDISISAPFWKTIWFYLVCCAGAVFFTYAVIHYRERTLLRDKLILEARVKRRTLEIQRQNDEIQAQNEEIMAQAEEIRGINENLELIVHERTAELQRKNIALEEYAFINAHKLRSPVASILGLVNLISRTHLDPEGKEISKRLQQSADELDEIVRSITKAIEKGDKEVKVRND